MFRTLAWGSIDSNPCESELTCFHYCFWKVSLADSVCTTVLNMTMSKKAVGMHLCFSTSCRVCSSLFCSLLFQVCCVAVCGAVCVQGVLHYMLQYVVQWTLTFVVCGLCCNTSHRVCYSVCYTSSFPGYLNKLTLRFESKLWHLLAIYGLQLLDLVRALSWQSLRNLYIVFWQPVWDFKRVFRQSVNK